MPSVKQEREQPLVTRRDQDSLQKSGIPASGSPDSPRFDSAPPSATSSPLLRADTPRISEPGSPSRDLSGAALTQEPGGIPVRAFVGGSSAVLVPNSLGLFPCQPIGLQQTVPVKVQFPGGVEGELVVVQAEDGGLLDGAGVVVRKVLDADAALQFSFTSTLEGGRYFITLRKGLDEKRLEFFASRVPPGATHSTTP